MVACLHYSNTFPTPEDAPWSSGYPTPRERIPDANRAALDSIRWVCRTIWCAPSAWTHDLPLSHDLKGPVVSFIAAGQPVIVLNDHKSSFELLGKVQMIKEPKQSHELQVLREKERNLQSSPSLYHGWRTLMQWNHAFFCLLRRIVRMARLLKLICHWL